MRHGSNIDHHFTGKKYLGVKFTFKNTVNKDLFYGKSIHIFNFSNQKKYQIFNWPILDKNSCFCSTKTFTLNIELVVVVMK